MIRNRRPYSAITAALLAELGIRLGKYRSSKKYLLSFVVFNLNMACPYMMISYARDSFLKRSVEYFGQEYADGIGKLAGLIMIMVSIFLLSGGYCCLSQDLYCIN